MAIEYFADLGSQIASTWDRHARRPSDFRAIAFECLQQRPPALHVTSDMVVDWVADASELPPQPNLDSQFGQPPVTVFWHPRFHIEVLYWTSGTTTVHQHNFSGAFSVLGGSSIQCRYTFEGDGPPGAPLMSGRLSLRDTRLLDVGDTELISSGAELIHNVFHLGFPSITVVVRADADSSAGPQYRYYGPSVAIDPKFPDPITKRRVQLLELLAKVRSDRFEHVAARMLTHSDAWGTFHLLRAIVSLERDPDVVEHLVEVAHDRQGGIARSLVAAAEENTRQERLIRLRSEVTAADSRFLLALLINVPRLQEVLAIVKARYPGADPVVRASELATELLRVTDGQVDTLTQDVLYQLFSGRSIDAATACLARQWVGADVADAPSDRHGLLLKCLTVAAAPLFAGVFRAGEVSSNRSTR
jgi:hypothetical protein